MLFFEKLERNRLNRRWISSGFGPLSFLVGLGQTVNRFNFASGGRNLALQLSKPISHVYESF